MQTTTISNKKQKTQYIDASLTTTATQNPPGCPAALPKTPPELPPDAREQLYNEGSIGPIDHIQVSTERIVKLRGILFDIDPQNLRKGPLLPALCEDPQQFYENCLLPWLANHAVLQHLEVRASGTGLHAILWLDPPVAFADDAERKRWCSIVKIVQCALLTDPMAPGLTSTTRALGSINTKNGQFVRRLKEGTSVSPEKVIALSEEMCESPFRTLFTILTGSDRISPCPYCGKESLVALNHIGKCYGCGKVNFERLCGQLFRPSKGTEG